MHRIHMVVTLAVLVTAAAARAQQIDQADITVNLASTDCTGAPVDVFTSGVGICYDIMIRNEGPNAATFVNVSDILPGLPGEYSGFYQVAGPRFSFPPIPEDGILRWRISDFPSGAVAKFQIVMNFHRRSDETPTIMTARTITNEVIVESATYDPHGWNNLATLTNITFDPWAPLSTSCSLSIGGPSGEPITKGETLHYDNTGPNTFSLVELQDIPSVIEVRFHAPQANWGLLFNSGDHTRPLQVGHYDWSHRVDDFGYPILNVVGSAHNPHIGLSCNDPFGSFDISVLKIDYSYHPPRLMTLIVDFQQHCDSLDVPPLVGHLEINSAPAHRRVAH